VSDAGIIKRPDQFSGHTLPLAAELAKPPSCIHASRITVWVYQDQQGRICELVVIGHAESETCKRASSALIQGINLLSDQIDWMLNAGAAFIRVKSHETQPPRPHSPDPLLMARAMAGDRNALLAILGGGDGMGGDQKVLGKMIERLGEIAAATGLVDLIRTPVAVLQQFRTAFQGGAGRPAWIPPRSGQTAKVADLIPIRPARAGVGSCLEFHLEGWDFDTPQFQQVANVHLRAMRRELLGDAHYRIRKYRQWLQGGLRNWLGQLDKLPKAEAAVVRLRVPDRTVPGGSVVLGTDEFFQKHLERFVGGESWPRQFAQQFKKLRFGRAAPDELDEEFEIRVKNVDFGTMEEVEGTILTTVRRQATESSPSFISHALSHILRMQDIVDPYERQERGLVGKEGETDSEALLHQRISKSIVLESMIRGWPPTFLQEEEDRSQFKLWAGEVRDRIWGILNRQARDAGVHPQVLAEDNVTFEIRFGEDLDCWIRPMMIGDDANHAQIHGVGTLGASVFFPVWTRTKMIPLEADGIALGADNTTRARKLVDLSRNQKEQGARVYCLQLALACHPGIAGKEILMEWNRRSGRDTSEEFTADRLMVEAAECLMRGRFAEGEEKIKAHLAVEQDPLPDAWIIWALCEAQRTHRSLAHLRRCASELEAYRKVLQGLQENVERARAGKKLSEEEIAALEQAQGLPDLFKRKQKELEGHSTRRREEQAQARAIIESALERPGEFLPRFPGAAQAAESFPALLRETLGEENSLHWSPGSRYFSRYYPVRAVVEAREGLALLWNFAKSIYLVAEGGAPERKEALALIKQASSHLWLPGMEAESGADGKLNAFVSDIDPLFQSGRDTSAWDSVLRLRMKSLLQEVLVEVNDYFHSVVLSDLLKACHLAEARTTRLHFLQIFQSDYLEMWQELQHAIVPFSRAFCRWRQVDSTEKPLHGPGASLTFNPTTGTISLVSGSAPHGTLLQTDDVLTGEEAARIQEILASLPVEQEGPIDLATLILRAPVEPTREWKDWIEAMTLVRPALFHALSTHCVVANLIPELTPPLTEDGKKYYRQLDHAPPVQSVEIDWRGSDLGEPWNSLVPAALRG